MQSFLSTSALRALCWRREGHHHLLSLSHVSLVFSAIRIATLGVERPVIDDL